MEVSNVALAAYIDTLTEFGHEPSKLITNTELSWDEAKNSKLRHRWDDFVTMTDYVFKTVGEENALKSINKTGVLNEELSTFRKITAMVLRPQSIYWFFCNFICRYMYKNVSFEYSKSRKNTIEIKIRIHEGYTSSENFIKAYATAFEGFPAALGHPNAKSTIKNFTDHSIISVELERNNMTWNPLKYMKRYIIGLVSTTKLLNEIEQRRYEQDLLNKKLENTNQKLNDSNKLNETLIRAIMHDIDNPLSIIKLKAEKLVNQDQKFSNKDKQILNRSINNMDKVIQNIKEFYIAKQSNKNELINLEESVREVESVLSHVLQDKGIVIDFNSSLPKNYVLFGNRSIFSTSILSNLITNAIKFSFEDTIITIKAFMEEGKVILTIKDTGMGMNENSLNSFYSHSLVQSTSGTHGEVGLGVGLTQVLFFMKEMNADIEVYTNRLSDNPLDHGTEFKLIFNSDQQEASASS